MYQAALKDGDKRADGHIFRGILRWLAKALMPPNRTKRKSASLAPFSGAKFCNSAEAVALDGISPLQVGRERLRRRKSSAEVLNPSAGTEDSVRYGHQDGHKVFSALRQHILAHFIIGHLVLCYSRSSGDSCNLSVGRMLQVASGALLQSFSWSPVTFRQFVHC